MNLRRATLLAGAIALLLSIVLLVTATVLTEAFQGGSSSFLSLSPVVGQALGAFGLLFLKHRFLTRRSVIRTLAGLLAVASCAGFVYLVLSATMTPPADRLLRNHPSIALEYLLMAHAGNLAIALSLLGLTLSGWRRTGASAAGALAITTVVLGIGVIVYWLVSMDTAAPPLLEAALAAATFGALGIGLFCAAKEQLDHFSATHQTAPVDHRLLAATCTCLGLILFTGVLLFGFVVRDADDFQRLVEVDRFQQALQTVEADLHSAVAEGRRFIASNDLDAEAFVASVRTVDHGLNELPLLTSDPQQTVLVSVVLNRANSIIQPLRRAVALRRSGRTSEASEAVVAIHLDNRLESFAASVSQLAISLNAGMADRGRARIHRHRSVAIFAPASGIVIIALLGTIHLYFEWQSSARHRSESAMRRHNETLRGFAHTVAHDLRAPLRGIAGYATELDGHAHLVGARGRHCINQIQHAAQNLERLIGDTLDYAQLDAETPQLTPVDLPSLVASLRQQRAEEIRKHGTQVDTQFGISEVMCWERGLAQIVGNLLDNAIKYSRNAQPPRIRIETAQTPLSWRLVIYDNGIGFDMKYHDRIFGLFQRLVTTEEFEGTGAGLAIVRKITDRLGGRVYAEGRPGGGATFLVELPRITNNDLA